MGWWCHFGGHARHGFHHHGQEHGFRGRYGWQRGHGEAGGVPAVGDRLMLTLVLDALAAQPGSGYDVVKALESRLEPIEWGFGPQAVYPMLRLAEDAGFVAATGSGGKASYAVTEAGRAQLAGEQDALKAFWTRVGDARAQAELGALFGDVRALAWAFREALGSERLDAARVTALKAAIAQARDALRPDRRDDVAS